MKSKISKKRRLKKCRFFHKWSMYGGHEQIRIHEKAVCLRCGIPYKETK